MNKSMRNRVEDGFTLIELIVVIAIIGILATFVVPNVMGRTDQAKVSKVKTDFKTLDTQCARGALRPRRGTRPAGSCASARPATPGRARGCA